jgi:hypothetical protein
MKEGWTEFGKSWVKKYLTAFFYYYCREHCLKNLFFIHSKEGTVQTASKCQLQ